MSGRKQLTLATVMIVVVMLAIHMAQVRSIFDMKRSEVSLLILATDGDAEALARDVISPAVLDQALRTTTADPNNIGALVPLSTVTPFATSSDPRAELRDLLTVDSDRKARTVRLSTVVSGNPLQALLTLSAVQEACERVLGPQRVLVASAPKLSSNNSMFQLVFLMMITMCVTRGIGWYRRHRSKRQDAAKPR